MAKRMDLLNTTMKSLSAGGMVFLGIANPVNLLFVVLIVMAGFALFNEQIILVGMISMLALLSAALGAALLAIFMVSTDKTLSSRGFELFLGLAFVIPLVIWSFEIFNTIPSYPWLHVVGLGAIMLVCSLNLVPRLRRLYQSNDVMA